VLARLKKGGEWAHKLENLSHRRKPQSDSKDILRDG
jgi:hypothetical protein